MDDVNSVGEQRADRPQQQAVIVNTSGANTAYLPTPQNMGSPLTTANAIYHQQVVK